MTANLINYWSLVERRRAAQASEAEARRSNEAKETETNRHNLETESISAQEVAESRRHNVAMESENQRTNKENERIREQANIISDMASQRSQEASLTASARNYAASVYAAQSSRAASEYASAISAENVRRQTDTNEIIHMYELAEETRHNRAVESLNTTIARNNYKLGLESNRTNYLKASSEAELNKAKTDLTSSEKSLNESRTFSNYMQGINYIASGFNNTVNAVGGIIGFVH